MSLRVVCFDLGHVLVRIRNDWGEAFASVGAAQHHLDNVPFDAFPEFLRFQDGGIGEEDYLDALAMFAGTALDQAKRAHNAIVVGEHEGIDELLGRLRLNSLRLGCLSNTNVIHWRMMTDPNLFPTVARLDIQAASHEIGSCKPSVPAFEAFRIRAGVQPEEILFFDDSDVNVRAAVKLGWKARWVDSSKAPQPQLRRALARLGLI